MEFRKVRALRGPNIWANFPVLEAWLDLGRLKDSPSDELPGFNDRLMTWLPTLVEHRCSVGKRGGFFERLRRGTYQAHILEHVCLELQTLAGTEVGFGRTRETFEDGVYKVAIQYDNEELARACLGAARELCLAAVEDRPYDVAAEVVRLREVELRTALAPGLSAILAAAKARQVPILPLGAPGLYQLGHGTYQRRVWGSRTDAAGSIAEDMAQDRVLTATLLSAAGVPTPEWQVVTDADSACRAAEDIGLPVLVRPRRGDDSRFFGRNLTTLEQVRAAYAVTRAETSAVVIERHAVGDDFRLLVVDGKMVAAARRDGGRGRQASGVDVTDMVHPAVAARAVDAARALNLPIAGVDVVTTDISHSLEETGGMVVSVHPRPGLRLHLAPSQSAPGPVAEAVVDHLFPESEPSRVPIVAVTGVNGKTTTTRLIGHIVARWGRVVGMTCTEGIYIDGRRIETGDCSGPLSARTVLEGPTVEAAVLETARGGILRAGLGFDWCDVGVVTNIGEGDHLGIADIDNTEQLARVKRTVVEAVAPQGTAILNAADTLVAGMAAYCPGSVLYFAVNADNPVLAAHRAAKCRAAFVRDRHIVLAEGQQEIPLVSLEDVPLTHGGRVNFQVENALAAAGAAWCMGVPCEVIRVGLETFVSDCQKAPGRFNLLDVGGATVVLDYGHNTSSLAALIETFGQLPHRRRTAVYSAAGDRRDCDLIRQGELLAAAFDRVILFEDPNCNRGRKDGEIMALFHKGMARGPRLTVVEEVPGAVRAVEHAMAHAQPGELILAQVDLVDETLDLVRRAWMESGLAREIDLAEAMKLGRCQPALA
jgi:cyanophycin synthetase